MISCKNEVRLSEGMQSSRALSTSSTALKSWIMLHMKIKKIG